MVVQANNGGRSVSDCHARDNRPDGKLAWRSGKTAHRQIVCKAAAGIRRNRGSRRRSRAKRAGGHNSADGGD